MRTISIHAAVPYPVHIGTGLMQELGSLAASAAGEVGKVAVVSDSMVFPLYGGIVSRSLKDAGWEVVSYVLPQGESSKNGENYLALLTFLAENQLTRSDLVVALGGGVVGDLAGFAAATYLRGIRFIQVPTTLLAAVDASVGGKTAIDLPAGKNLAGAFHQPAMVLCDTSALDTLPQPLFRDGCAEVIKYGILYDPALFTHLEQCGPAFHREAVIARCVELKGQVVAEDEFDNGQRQKLNLGHTVGHGIERCSGYSISHGSAVGTGTAIITRAACSLGLCTAQTRDRILSVLLRFGLDVTTTYSAQALAQAACMDKKRSGGTLNLILPEQIGACRIVPTPVVSLQQIIEMGL